MSRTRSLGSLDHQSNIKAGHNNLEEYQPSSDQTSKEGDEQISSKKCLLELYSRKANNQISSRTIREANPWRLRDLFGVKDHRKKGSDI